MNNKLFSEGRIPLLLRRGGCGINKKSRSHRSAADGVVAYTQWSKNAFRNMVCERPPRPLPSKVASRHLFDVASTPPHEEGNMPARMRPRFVQIAR
jgi:hypothetical protein